MPFYKGLEQAMIPTFDSPKVDKSEAPHHAPAMMGVLTDSFFVPGGNILNDRLVTFYSAARLYFIRKW